MDEHVYRVINVVGASKVSVEDAIQRAVARAAKNLHGLRWFEVAETRGQIDGANVTQYQVTLKVGFTLDET